MAGRNWRKWSCGYQIKRVDTDSKGVARYRLVAADAAVEPEEAGLF